MRTALRIPPRRRRARWPWVVAAVVVLGAAAWLARFSLLAPPPAPMPSPPAATTTTSVPPTTTLPARTDLPAVGESDPLVRDEARPLSAEPAWESWLRSPALLQRFVTAVENVADGDSPRAQLGFLAPQGSFRVRTEGGRTVVDPAAYARYDAVADVIASLDAASCARLYAAFRPLLESAYRELGRPDRTFDQTLSLAIARLLAVPVVDGPVELTPQVTVQSFADARLEALSPAEKHLLRMGPRNVRLVQGKLREIEAALGR